MSGVDSMADDVGTAGGAQHYAAAGHEQAPGFGEACVEEAAACPDEASESETESDSESESDSEEESAASPDVDDVAFKINAFYQTYALQGDTEDLIDEVMGGRKTTEQVLHALATRHNKPPQLWTGCDALSPFILAEFFRRFSLRPADLPALLDAVADGTASHAAVVQRLCAAHGVPLADWQGDRPAAIVRGAPAPADVQPPSTAASQAGFEVDEEEEEWDDEDAAAAAAAGVAAAASAATAAATVAATEPPTGEAPAPPHSPPPVATAAAPPPPHQNLSPTPSSGGLGGGGGVGVEEVSDTDDAAAAAPTPPVVAAVIVPDDDAGGMLQESDLRASPQEGAVYAAEDVAAAAAAPAAPAPEESCSDDEADATDEQLLQEALRRHREEEAAAAAARQAQTEHEAAEYARLEAETQAIKEALRVAQEAELQRRSEEAEAEAAAAAAAQAAEEEERAEAAAASAAAAADALAAAQAAAEAPAQEEASRAAAAAAAAEEEKAAAEAAAEEAVAVEDNSPLAASAAAGGDWQDYANAVSDTLVPPRSMEQPHEDPSPFAAASHAGPAAADATVSSAPVTDTYTPQGPFFMGLAEGADAPAAGGPLAHVGIGAPALKAPPARAAAAAARGAGEGLPHRSASETSSRAELLVAEERRRQRAVWQEKIEDLYRRYNPEKIGQVDALLDHYEGNEISLYDAIVQKYMLVPAATAAAAPPPAAAHAGASSAAAPEEVREVAPPARRAASGSAATTTPAATPHYVVPPPQRTPSASFALRTPVAAAEDAAAAAAPVWSPSAAQQQQQQQRPQQQYGADVRTRSPQPCMPLRDATPGDDGSGRVSAVLRSLYPRVWTDPLREQVAADEVIRCLQQAGESRMVVAVLLAVDPESTGVVGLDDWLGAMRGGSPLHQQQGGVAVARQPAKRKVQTWYEVRTASGNVFLKNRTTGERVLKEAVDSTIVPQPRRMPHHHPAYQYLDPPSLAAKRDVSASRAAAAAAVAHLPLDSFSERSDDGRGGAAAVLPPQQQRRGFASGSRRQQPQPQSMAAASSRSRSTSRDRHAGNPNYMFGLPGARMPRYASGVARRREPSMERGRLASVSQQPQQQHWGSPQDSVSQLQQLQQQQLYQQQPLPPQPPQFSPSPVVPIDEIKEELGSTIETSLQKIRLDHEKMIEEATRQQMFTSEEMLQRIRGEHEQEKRRVMEYHTQQIDRLKNEMHDIQDRGSRSTADLKDELVRRDREVTALRQALLEDGSRRTLASEADRQVIETQKRELAALTDLIKGSADRAARVEDELRDVASLCRETTREAGHANRKTDTLERAFSESAGRLRVTEATLEAALSSALLRQPSATPSAAEYPAAAPVAAVAPPTLQAQAQPQQYQQQPACIGTPQHTAPPQQPHYPAEHERTPPVPHTVPQQPYFPPQQQQQQVAPAAAPSSEPVPPSAVETQPHPQQATTPLTPPPPPPAPAQAAPSLPQPTPPLQHHHDPPFPDVVGWQATQQPQPQPQPQQPPQEAQPQHAAPASGATSPQLDDLESQLSRLASDIRSIKKAPSLAATPRTTPSSTPTPRQKKPKTPKRKAASAAAAAALPPPPPGAPPPALQPAAQSFPAAAGGGGGGLEGSLQFEAPAAEADAMEEMLRQQLAAYNAQEPVEALQRETDGSPLTKGTSDKPDILLFNL